MDVVGAAVKFDSYPVKATRTLALLSNREGFAETIVIHIN